MTTQEELRKRHEKGICERCKKNGVPVYAVKKGEKARIEFACIKCIK